MTSFAWGRWRAERKRRKRFRNEEITSIKLNYFAFSIVMSLLKPFSKLPGLNSANILVSGFYDRTFRCLLFPRYWLVEVRALFFQLVESEEQLQQPLADVLVEEATFTVNVWVKRSPFSRMLMEAGFKRQTLASMQYGVILSFLIQETSKDSSFTCGKWGESSEDRLGGVHHPPVLRTQVPRFNGYSFIQ